MSEIIVDSLTWVIYHMLVVGLIAVDLVVGVRRGKELTLKTASKWVLLWITVGVSFGLYIMYHFGVGPASIYFAAYVLEYSLSMDNLFVFAIILTYFAVPPAARNIALYSGILMAIGMRAGFIFGGLWLLETYHWMVFVFGAILIYSGLKIWRGGAEKAEVNKNPIVKLAKRILPITNEYHGSKFIVRGSKFKFTPLVVVLLALASSDLMFAFDSVPAAIVLTKDFFIAYTSNISAVLGLRALFFVIALTMFKFRYIGKGLAFILAFLGIKFFLAGVEIEIPTLASLGVVFGTLAVAVLASMLRKQVEETVHSSTAA